VHEVEVAEAVLKPVAKVDERAAHQELESRAEGERQRDTQDHKPRAKSKSRLLRHRG
jgi:hypothetical protein